MLNEVDSHNMATARTGLDGSYQWFVNKKLQEFCDCKTMRGQRDNATWVCRWAHQNTPQGSIPSSVLRYNPGLLQPGIPELL